MVIRKTPPLLRLFVLCAFIDVWTFREIYNLYGRVLWSKMLFWSIGSWIFRAAKSNLNAEQRRAHFGFSSYSIPLVLMQPRIIRGCTSFLNISCFLQQFFTLTWCFIRNVRKELILSKESLSVATVNTSPKICLSLNKVSESVHLNAYLT